MKAYILKSNKTIEPFGDHPRDCLIVNKPLSIHQQEALQSQNISMVTISDQEQIQDTDEYLVFGDYLYFTPELLNEFISRSRSLRCRTVAALKPGITTLRCMAATQSVDKHEDYIGYCLSYIPGEENRQGDTQTIVIDTDQFSEFVPVSKHMSGDTEYRVPLTDRLLIQIEHWTSLWGANIGTLLTGMYRVKNRPKLSLLWLALKARSFNQWNVLHHVNKFGKGCDIHPTAYIEGSTIGNGVKIGAMAIVRESVVGDNSYIANNAAVELSVIGEGSCLQGGVVVQYSVLYPGSFTFAKSINTSFMGKNSFMAGAASLSDFRFDGKSVTVIKDGEKVDTGNTFLGACLGHGAYLGSGCIVAPGRTIPNGMRINPENSRIISKCSAEQEIEGYQRTIVQPQDS
jgi:acetyltransferase-like isoleucine patch superfamily enzyme